MFVADNRWRWPLGPFTPPTTPQLLSTLQHTPLLPHSPCHITGRKQSERTLDVICGDQREFELWYWGLQVVRSYPPAHFYAIIAQRGGEELKPQVRLCLQAQSCARGATLCAVCPFTG